MAQPAWQAAQSPHAGCKGESKGKGNSKQMAARAKTATGPKTVGKAESLARRAAEAKESDSSRRLVHLCGLSQAQVCFLCSDKLYDNLSVVSVGPSNEFESRACSTSDLPWTSAFLLGFFHRRHRRCSRRVPSTDWVVDPTRVLCKRLAWRYHFLNQGSSSRIRLCRKLFIARFSNLLPPELGC